MLFLTENMWTHVRELKIFLPWNVPWNVSRDGIVLNNRWCRL